MKEPEVGVSTTAFGRRGPREVLGELPPLGVKLLEVNLNWTPLGWQKLEHRRLRDQCIQGGFELALHAPHLHVDPANPDVGVAEPSRSLLGALLRLAGGLRARYVVFHPPPAGDTVEEGVAALGELRARSRLELLLENPWEGPGAAERELERLLDDARMGLLLDLGHLHLARKGGLVQRDLADFLSAFGDRVRGVHLHEPEGGRDSHGPLGAGAFALEPVLRLLRERGMGPWVVEVYRRESLVPSLERIRGFLQGAAEEESDGGESRG
ncbi:MAG: TIM barrel protein [Euryarchaeota archaeon]|nr:TIM barrel protein [Euryarchaeota archaeon]